MNNSKVSTSKVLLIILGVLAAIVIGFSSKAVGANGKLILPTSSKTNLEKKTEVLMKNTSAALTKSVIDFLTYK